ncbi:hypothetical protein AB5J49_03180 [Streptomyces sp. R28]|uniref:Uncharacterized protein n=1 Tax=Streptomyces sp. R28 TaxID=3238628 RepID=A0AB39PSC7_9ACTN
MRRRWAASGTGFPDRVPFGQLPAPRPWSPRDGSGFIATWGAALACGFSLRRLRATETATGPQEGPERTAEFTESLGGLLASVSLLVFGVVLLGPTLEELSRRGGSSATRCSASPSSGRCPRP